MSSEPRLDPDLVFHRERQLLLRPQEGFFSGLTGLAVQMMIGRFKQSLVPELESVSKNLAAVTENQHAGIEERR